MNLVAKNDEEWFIIGVWMGTDGRYEVRSSYFYPDGKQRITWDVCHSLPLESAIKRAKSSLRFKIKKKNMTQVPLDELPSVLLPRLAPSLDSWVSPQDMLGMVISAKAERYVYFDIVDGIEDRFDEGLEYLGFVSDKDAEFVNVYDKFGELCNCHVSRFSAILETERAEEANRLSRKGV